METSDTQTLCLSFLIQIALDAIYGYETDVDVEPQLKRSNEFLNENDGKKLFFDNKLCG